MAKSKTNKQEQAKLKRREEHERRLELCNSLTTEQRIARLDAKLGKGVGAKKERERLQKKCNQP